jgi:ADP-ribosyl-[dinitrogen reductase] hydrolase
MLENMYEDSIYKTIQQGGDTDTNACIVGGMIGALVGIKGIPKLMVKKILCFDCTNPKNFRPRPKFLSVKANGVQGIVKLIKNIVKGKL